MTAGYSGRPLVDKLGIRPESRVALLGAPAGFSLPGVKARTRLGGRLDVLLFFVLARRDLEGRIALLGRAVRPAGSLWVAWPKRASKVSTDITEDVVREVALPLGLVDNKVCAIDETWSGLRLVWRKELRGDE